MNDESKRDGFQKFWTKDKTQCLLEVLEENVHTGSVDHEKVAQILTERLLLSQKLESEQIGSRLSVLVSNFRRENDREQKSGVKSQWRWKSHLEKITSMLIVCAVVIVYLLFQLTKTETVQDETDTESETEQNLSSSNDSKSPLATPKKEFKTENNDDTGIDTSKSNSADCEEKSEKGSNVAERRGRMPDQHVGTEF